MTESGFSPMSQRRNENGSRSSVSVCLPALNEETTIGGICKAIRAALMPGVVDELIVIDTDSSDATTTVAAAAGAAVYKVDDIGPRLQGGGKGESLWKSVAVAHGDIIVWIDSDIQNFTPDFVTRLISPLRLATAHHDEGLLPTAPTTRCDEPRR
jgi:glucosyl-3-phosphoglycerate synthase